ncbi:hypothetical protein OHB12_04655 [Nocardia sp. NBC_01730]|uniref:hypothetical protein n=1 Tax=Nocardia sp. NBC_01730 TaxID=2975998 RepID=UPI002E141682|nr:hypothetical protein OHB12_04655 [Nocardia sp. NBC_01730]
MSTLDANAGIEREPSAIARGDECGRRGRYPLVGDGKLYPAPPPDEALCRLRAENAERRRMNRIYADAITQLTVTNMS